MLNPTFSPTQSNRIIGDYIAPIDIAESSLRGNANFDTGIEYRLQNVYGDEIWLKLEKAGFTVEKLNNSSILEVCAGNGFLTFHLLKRIVPSKYVINDLSGIELMQNKKLISSNFTSIEVTYLEGDIHEPLINEKFDLVIGNSFLHHFHNVPKAINSILAYVKPGGAFISLHEPTPLSTVVEGAKIYALPFGILFPTLLNNLIRRRYQGPPSETDLWMFEKNKLKKVLKNLGITDYSFYSWNLFRPIIVQKNSMHLTEKKSFLTDRETKKLHKTVIIDSILSKILPARFFGSLCIVIKK
jgi:SAM-dependent methyltransferase